MLGVLPPGRSRILVCKLHPCSTPVWSRRAGTSSSVAPVSNRWVRRLLGCTLTTAPSRHESEPEARAPGPSAPQRVFYGAVTTTFFGIELHVSG